MNRVIINGYLGKEPEVKKTTTGKSVCSFSLAVDFGKAEDGSRKSKWFYFSAWNNTADYLGMYCHKGDKILVEGRLDSREWESDSGTRTLTEIVCDRIEVERSAQANPGQTNTRPIKYAPRSAQESVTEDIQIDTDDLPF